MKATGPLPADPPASKDLDHRLAATLERVGHVVRALVWRQAYANGLSPTQTQLVLHLAGTVRPLRVSDLAAEFDVSLATISDALTALRRKQLIDRQPDTNDRRSYVFVLTDSGRHLATRLSVWSDPITVALAGVPDEDKASTLRLLLDLIAELHDNGALAVARTCVTCRFFQRDAHDDPHRPHHCRLLDTPFSNAALRLDCAEHQPRDRQVTGG